MQKAYPKFKFILEGDNMTTKLGLVAEGGGMRSLYLWSFKGFMDEGLDFPYIIGVSAGANNAANFISGQERNKKVL